ncbi:hypothetical protein [Citreimonas salinaria]|uniref:Uncharacterized protein n=1 Tax=Citreimonas salinaria TaxID=321339 RepID=A0A1H3N474_9RHOB|nr:hypothetical protein [Citreimonas salinaria]SDY83682.1 hypothetical protein SAMN05444340_12021 [Citreimonas salinaria]
MQGPIQTRLPVLTRRALLALAALVPGLRSARAGTPANAKEDARRPRPVIRLSCPDDAPDPLCLELVQALAGQAPGHVIRRVEAAGLRPARPEDLGVALVMLAAAGNGVRARLDLQPAAGSRRTGPAVTDPALPAAEPPGQPAAWRGFARALAQTLAPGLEDAPDSGPAPGASKP